MAQYAALLDTCAIFGTLTRDLLLGAAEAGSKDPDDAHVIASALVGKADAVVTRNLEHFPGELVEKLGLEAIHPDDFLVYQWDLDSKLMLKVAQGCHRKLRKSPPTWDEWLARLKKQGVGLHLFAAKLSEVEAEASVVQSQPQPERQS